MPQERVPMVMGILETALSVKDVAGSAAFYRGLFNASVLLDSDRLVALNIADRNVLLLFEAGATERAVVTPGGLIPGHRGEGSGHVAFSIGGDDFGPWVQRLEAEGIPIESRVQWNGGARSLYFRDPDGHLIELITPGFWSIY